jgi:hydroxymethylglutaryl-CoA reductase (NADPH)
MDAPPLDGSVIAEAPRHAPSSVPTVHRTPDQRLTIPYAKRRDDDYDAEAIARRQEFIEELTGVRLEHLVRYSFDPQCTRGNIENFTGVAQVPIGFAGPLRINGEHATGDFLIPLATTEGSLVASYNRGIKVLNLSGGATCTVSGSAMQRAPVFVFDSAREARGFRDWTTAHLAEIRAAAERTDPFVKLTDIEIYLSNKFAYLRFDYDTGDAAGQNMVGLATSAACDWIGARVPGIRKLYLESNLATDKKTSQVNVMRTRGKRVTAEAVIPRAVLQGQMRADPESIHHHGRVANIGALLAGANNNGLHSANAITAMFIATGQDVANVAEGSAGLIYSEVTAEGDLYLSITIPSLIVATHGGGTGLPTQRECLEVLGCRGKGKVNKLAEIVAGVVLAGEISLAAAISANEWVSAHQQLGRNDK